MTGHDQHRLGDQAEPALFHDGGRHGHRLAGADGMGEIGRAIGDDAPDAALLVRVELERGGGAGQLEMRAIELARREIVEALVIDAGQPVGPLRVGPDPAFELALDLLQLLAGSFGIDDVQHPPFAADVLEGVEDLRHAAVERIGKELAGVPAAGAPFRGAGGTIGELARFDGPGTEFRHMVDLDVSVHRLLDEGDDIGGWNPRRAETRGDIRWTQGRGLNSHQRAHVALKGRIERRGGFRGGKLGADRAGEIGVGGLPRAIGRVLEHGVTELVDHLVTVAMQKLGDMVEVDATALVEHDGKRVAGIRHHRRGRGCNDALREDRSGLGRIGIEIVVLDGSNQPAVGIVPKWLEVRLAVGLAGLTGLVVLGDGDGRVVDRPEIPDEARPGDAQPHL